jgi:sodium-dependent dicarboxylate transporter 2/3/5
VPPMPVAHEDDAVLSQALASSTRESIAVGEVSSLVASGGSFGSVTSVRRVDRDRSRVLQGLRVLASVDSKIWTLVLTPLFLSPLLLHGGSPGFPAPAARTLGSTIMIATYWSTEALPLAVTAMLPLVLLPLLGVQPGKDVARSYFQDTNLLFLGGLMVASAIEKANLHRRIALRVLLAVGTAPRQLYLGFMLACGFLSMWISNTAATAMMIPIARTLIESIEEAHANPVSPPPCLAEISVAPQPTLNASPCQENDVGATRTSPSAGRGSDRRKGDEPTPLELYTKGLLLSIAYASSIGGIATLTGTGPNLVFSGAITKIFPGAPEVSFTQWMAFACPVSITLMLIVWAWMCFLFATPKRRSLSDGGGQHEALPTVPPEEVGRQYRMLGPLSYQERMVLGHFSVLTFLWIMRNPLIVPVSRCHLF